MSEFWKNKRRGGGAGSAADWARKNATRKSSGPQGESKLSKKLKDDLHTLFPGSRWWKNAGGDFAENGMPDIMGVVNGRLIAIEVKRNTGWFKPLQIMFLKELERAGAVAIGFLHVEGDGYYIIPTAAMGHKGNRKRELWFKIDYPTGLKSLPFYTERAS